MTMTVDQRKQQDRKYHKWIAQNWLQEAHERKWARLTDAMACHPFSTQSINGEDEAERQSIREWLAEDPIASYRIALNTSYDRRGNVHHYARSLTDILYKYGGEFPETLSPQEAEAYLMGDKIHPEHLSNGRIPTEDALDCIALHFDMSVEDFKDRVEQVYRAKKRLAELR